MSGHTLQGATRRERLARFEHQYAAGLGGACEMPIGKMRGRRIDSIPTPFLRLSLNSVSDRNRRERFPKLEEVMLAVLASRPADDDAPPEFVPGADEACPFEAVR